jgi:hypothetical protein
LADALPTILSLGPLRKQEWSTQPDEATDGLDEPCGCGPTCDGGVTPSRVAEVRQAAARSQLSRFRANLVGGA